MCCADSDRLWNCHINDYILMILRVYACHMYKCKRWRLVCCKVNLRALDKWPTWICIPTLATPTCSWFRTCAMIAVIWQYSLVHQVHHLATQVVGIHSCKVESSRVRIHALRLILNDNSEEEHNYNLRIYLIIICMIAAILSRLGDSLPSRSEIRRPSQQPSTAV